MEVKSILQGAENEKLCLAPSFNNNEILYMCSREACPLHLVYLKFPFLLLVPVPAGLPIIQVAGSCLCFWQAKAKDLLCVISWSPGVALQIMKGDARFLCSCHFHFAFSNYF